MAELGQQPRRLVERRRWSAESRANDPGGSLDEIAIRSGIAGGVWAASQERAARRRDAVAVAGDGAVHHVEQQRAVGDRARERAEGRQAEPAVTAAAARRRGRASASCPTSPQQAAGIRIEPPPSEAPAAGTSPAATAAAEPPEEPPGVRVRSHGLRVTPSASLAVHGNSISSGTRVIPIGIAPAARSRRSASASAVCGCAGDLEPRVVAWPPKRHVVLDRDRHAGQRPRALHRPAVDLRRGRQRLVRERLAERVQTRVEPLDPRQRQLDELARADLALAHTARELERPRECELVLLGATHGASVFQILERQQQLADRRRVAVGDAAVAAVEELEAVLDPERVELG